MSCDDMKLETGSKPGFLNKDLLFSQKHSFFSYEACFFKESLSNFQVKYFK